MTWHACFDTQGYRAGTPSSGPAQSSPAKEPRERPDVPQPSAYALRNARTTHPPPIRQLRSVSAVVSVPCVIYAAKSTEDLRGSLITQVEDCRRAINAEQDRDVVAEYADEAVSGFTRSRGPALTAALGQVEALGAEHGCAELWVQHSDRLARGDGRTARHVVEIALWAIKTGVAVRPVEDVDTFRDLLYAVVTGERNHEDSRRKGAATRAGLKRAIYRGEYAGQPLDGYKVAVTADERGQVRRRS